MYKRIKNQQEAEFYTCQGIELYTDENGRGCMVPATNGDIEQAGGLWIKI